MATSLSNDSSTVIQTEGLTKFYGDTRAVEGVNLHVRAGEVYGFLGPNGAGKTTTLRMLLGLVKPTSGDAGICGIAVSSGTPRIFARVGYLIETAGAYGNLTVSENLDIQRRLTRSPRSAVHEAIDLMGLAGVANRRAGHLSLGNKQRLSLARALLHKPDVLILDEPANGLDPAGIIEVRKLLRNLAHEQGVTILMSSHILAEVAHLADRIGIIHEGRLLEELSYPDLAARLLSYLAVEVDRPDDAILLLREAFGSPKVKLMEDEIRIDGRDDLAPRVAEMLVGSGFRLRRLVPVREDLESYFVRLTQRQA